MTYKEFLAEVKRHGWSIAQLRCDVRPSDELLEFIQRVGERYEEFVLRSLAKI